MNENAELIADIREYCQRTGIAESTFGLRCVNDGKLVDRLLAGNTITLSTYRKVRALLDAVAPSEAAQ